jgi:hypothetical protein
MVEMVGSMVKAIFKRVIDALSAFSTSAVSFQLFRRYGKKLLTADERG